MSAKPLVVIFMGSKADSKHCEKIGAALKVFINCYKIIIHRNTALTMKNVLPQLTRHQLVYYNFLMLMNMTLDQKSILPLLDDQMHYQDLLMHL